jgi:Protein of unknown function (DUF3684)
MIKTGDWTIIDVVKHLITVQPSDKEIDRLRQIAAFSKEDEPSSKAVKQLESCVLTMRHKACDLYEPSEIFRNLKLPVLQWGTNTRWKPSSVEGLLMTMSSVRLTLICYSAKFMYNLGLRQSPPLSDIIELAASPDLEIGKKALRYFLDNFDSKYSGYDSQDYHDIAFIPADNQDGPLMAKPTEVSPFIDHFEAVII